MVSAAAGPGPSAERAGRLYGSDQSIGSCPSRSSAALARLNGREPKKPPAAASGDGWTEAIVGCRPGSPLARSWACRPQRIQTHGSSRSASARTARRVIASEPLPRWDPACPARTVSAELRRRTPRSAHGVRSPVRGAGTPHVGDELAEDVAERRRDRRAGRDGEREPHRLAGAVIGILSEDDDADRVEGRQLERPQDRRPRGVGRVAAGALGAEEVAVGGELLGAGGERLRPPGAEPRRSPRPPSIRCPAPRQRIRARRLYLPG